MEGQASPLVVKFADPPRERNNNNQGMGGGMGGFGGSAMMVLKKRLHEPFNLYAPNHTRLYEVLDCTHQTINPELKIVLQTSP